MKVEGARRNASASCAQGGGQVCGGQVGVVASATTLASYTEAQLIVAEGDIFAGNYAGAAYKPEPWVQR
jgi:hypothetical protein